MAKQQQRRKTTSRTKTTRRKSSSKRKQNTDLFTQFGQLLGRIIRDDRTTKVFGLIFWFFAIVLGLAFISYIFTGEADQSYVHQSGASLLLEGDTQTQNWLGRFGTVTSHFFFYKLFGLASFAIIFLLSAIGSKLLVKDLEISLGEVTRETFLFIIVCSAILGFLSSGDASGFPYGGALGTYIYNQVYALLGFIGTALLLLLGLAITLVMIFDVQFEEETISKSSFLHWLTRAFPSLSKKNEPQKGQSKKTRPKKTASDVAVASNMGAKKRQKLPEVREDINATIPALFEGEMSDEAQQIEMSFQQKILKPKRKSKKNPIKDNSDLLLDINTNKADVTAEKGIQETLRDKGTPPRKATSMEDSESPSPVLNKVDKTGNGDYDPTLDLSDYRRPPINLLEQYGRDLKGEADFAISREELERNKDQIVETLGNYNIEISKISATPGPTVTLYEIVPAPGVRISKIRNLEDDIALSLAALGIRIIAPMPGKGTIGIEVPNQTKEIVSLRSIIASEKFQKSKMALPVALGKTISNESFIADFAKMPHMLMAGATGQGKSVGINSILVSLLYQKHPAELKFVLIDPKKVELSLYNLIEKHFLAKLPDEEEAIVTDTKKVINTLNALCIEMDQRYDLLKMAHVRNVREYNNKFKKRKLNPEKGHRFLPYLVLVIDEFADLIMTAGKEVEMPIARLAQLARAVGVHLLIATQRPTVNIITGTIKANFPVRVAFRVTSKIDSRTILDQGGANQLIGRGDMLVSIGSEVIRLQGAFVDTPEVEKVVEFISEQRSYSDAFLLPEYRDDDASGKGRQGELEFDDLFEDAARIIVQHQQGSTSLLQRRLKLGYNRAGRLMDQLEATGIVGPNIGSKARDVYILDEYELSQHLQKLAI